MRRIGLILLISFIITANVSYAYTPSDINGVAIYHDKPYLLRVRVSVEHGNGTIIISGASGDTLFYESVREACYLAAWLNGYDPWSFNYNISIDLGHLNTTYLAGTSLSLAVFLAATSALTNSTINNDFLVTGMVNPDGTVGFVSYVDLKGELADKLRLPYYIYPALQENEYDIRRQNIHIGAYGFSTKAVIIKKGILHNIASTKRPVSNVIELVNFVSPKPTKINGNNISTMRGEPVKSTDAVRIINLVYNRTLIYLDYVNRTYQLSRENQITDRLETVGEGLSYANKLVKSAGAPNGDLYWKDVLSLLEAYRIASELYYSVLLLQNKASDVIAEYQLAKSIAGQILNDLELGVPLYGLPYAIEASYLYWSASREYNQTIPLALAYINGMGNSVALASSVARGMAEATNLMYRSAILASEAIVQEGPIILEAKIGEVAERLLEYGEHLKEYATSYVGVSRVRSDMIFLANGYLWLSYKLMEKNETGTLEKMVAMGYMIRAIALYSTYFALHPGFANVEDLRYNASSIILSYLLEKIGHPSFISYFNHAIQHNSTADKVYLNELYITYIKLIISSGGQESLELGSINVHPSSNRISSSDSTRPILSTLRLSYGFVTVLILLLIMIFIYIIKINRDQKSGRLV